MSNVPNPSDDSNHETDPEPAHSTRGIRSLTRTFSSFQSRNYRLFWIGQLFSVVGTWVQRVALAWLVLELTESSFALGLVQAIQFTPIMLFSLFGGVIADRLPKKRVLLTTQSLMSVQAFILGMLVWTDAIQVWQVYALALVHGLAVAFDNPTRQAFVAEMVGAKQIANAVALNSSLFNSARMFGPAIGGALIALFGIAVPFFLNAASFAFVLIAITMIRTDELYDVGVRAKGRIYEQLREGISYVLTTPKIAMVLIIMALVGTFGYNFTLVLPLIARYVLDTGALGFGGLTSAMAIGSVAAALGVAYIARPTEKMLLFGATTFTVLLALVGISTFVPLTVVALIMLGAASIIFTSTANSRLQLLAPTELRGRVMGVYIFLFQGTAPLGNLAVGTMAEYWNVQASVLISAALCALGVALGVMYRARHRDDPATQSSAGNTQSAALD